VQHGNTYATTLATSQRIDWRIEGIIGGRRRLYLGFSEDRPIENG
jgi:hypothetical protein